jgi:hypothetical protein
MSKRQRSKVKMVFADPENRELIELEGDVYGQLALVYNPAYEHRISQSQWFISHVASQKLIDTIECPLDQAVIVINALQQFDFDAYWAKAQQGEIDKDFVTRVKFELDFFKTYC